MHFISRCQVCSIIIPFRFILWFDWLCGYFPSYSADNFRNQICCLEGFLKLEGISLLQPPGEVVDMTTAEFQEG
jgi:hypothetical protein